MSMHFTTDIFIELIWWYLIRIYLLSISEASIAFGRTWHAARYHIIGRDAIIITMINKASNDILWYLFRNHSFETRCHFIDIYGRRACLINRNNVNKCNQSIHYHRRCRHSRSKHLSVVEVTIPWLGATGDIISSHLLRMKYFGIE